MVETKRYADWNDINSYSIGSIRIAFENYISGPQISIEHKIHLMRVICDHIAGMTDRYAIQEYKELYD